MADFSNWFPWRLVAQYANVVGILWPEIVPCMVMYSWNGSRIGTFRCLGRRHIALYLYDLASGKTQRLHYKQGSKNLRGFPEGYMWNLKINEPARHAGHIAGLTCPAGFLVDLLHNMRIPLASFWPEIVPCWVMYFWNGSNIGTFRCLGRRRIA